MNFYNTYNAENQNCTSNDVSLTPTKTNNNNTIGHYLSLCRMTGGEIFSMSKHILEFIGGSSITKEGDLNNNVSESFCIMSALALHYEDLKEAKQYLMKIEELLGMEK